MKIYKQTLLKNNDGTTERKLVYFKTVWVDVTRDKLSTYRENTGANKDTHTLVVLANPMDTRDFTVGDQCEIHEQKFKVKEIQPDLEYNESARLQLVRIDK